MTNRSDLPPEEILAAVFRHQLERTKEELSEFYRAIYSERLQATTDLLHEQFIALQREVASLSFQVAELRSRLESL